MSSLGFESRPYGTAVSVANHYTRWVTELHTKTSNRKKINLIMMVLTEYLGDTTCGNNHTNL
ncbi:UNVERIFIED_CONTAM: hypothetical protein NCL1_21757 [Trichonephila clavipes]